MIAGVASCLFLQVLIVLIIPFCHGGVFDEYFYVQDANSKEVRHHVHEHLASQGTEPDFLFDKNYPNGRIVEFYAPWCPHCQHFKPKYIEFSVKIHDMSERMNVKVETFAISCVPNKQICKSQEVKAYPTTRFYPPHSINGTNISPFSLHPHDVLRKAKVLSEQQHRHSDEEATSISAKSRHNNRLDKVRVRLGHQLDHEQHEPEEHDGGNLPHFLPRSKVDAFRDAHLSFEFSMKTAVYTTDGPLSKERQGILNHFLQILQKTVPVTMTIQPILDDLLNNFDHISQGDDQLMEIMENHPSPFTSWSASSTLHGTGYTAGLWTLFHIMSVGFVEWNQMAMNDNQLLVPSEVADSLRAYIEHFFLCEVCRLNFLSEYDSCSYDRCNRLITKGKGTLEQYIQFPLWLYETHNAVNVRLRKERIELHDEPGSLTTEFDVMWPPVTSCPSCWRREGHWDESAIFGYLHDSYWTEAGIDAALTLQNPKHHESDNKAFPHHAGDPIEETEETATTIPGVFVVLTVSALSIAMVIVWQRKRQFDRKGFHKKIESL